MSTLRPALLPVLSLLLTPLLAGQCAQDNRSDPKAGILVSDLAISGTQTLSSSEIASITGKLTGSCFNEDSDEIGERIRMLFQNRGYFAAEVKGVRLKAADPLGIPKPVTVDAEVAEGPRYKSGEVTFVKNHAFTAERLRREFPVMKGEWFERDKVASGLEGLRKLYASQGFLDYMAIPETQLGSAAVVDLTVSFKEGPQYHLDKIEFVAEKQLAARLRARWKLREGSPYDLRYVDRFIEANRDLLPERFRREDVQVGKNCPEALVEVRLVIDPSADKTDSAPKSVLCKETDKE